MSGDPMMTRKGPSVPTIAMAVTAGIGVLVVDAVALFTTVPGLEARLPGSSSPRMAPA